jgi:hypothetical protein
VTGLIQLRIKPNGGWLCDEISASQEGLYYMKTVRHEVSETLLFSYLLYR